MQRAQVWFLVRELRSCMLCGVAEQETDREKERQTGAWIQEPASWIQVLILSLTSSEILDPLPELSLPQFPQYEEGYQEFLLPRVFSGIDELVYVKSFA